MRVVILLFFMHLKDFQVNNNFIEKNTSFVEERIKAITITKEVYGHILKNKEKYNQLANDYQSQALLALYQVLQEENFTLLIKILTHAQGASDKVDKMIQKVLYLFKTRLQYELIEKDEDQKDRKSQEVITLCIKNKLDKEFYCLFY